MMAEEGKVTGGGPLMEKNSVRSNGTAVEIPEAPQWKYRKHRSGNTGSTARQFCSESRDNILERLAFGGYVESYLRAQPNFQFVQVVFRPARRDTSHKESGVLPRIEGIFGALLTLGSLHWNLGFERCYFADERIDADDVRIYCAGRTTQRRQSRYDISQICLSSCGN